MQACVCMLLLFLYWVATKISIPLPCLILLSYIGHMFLHQLGWLAGSYKEWDLKQLIQMGAPDEVPKNELIMHWILQVVVSVEVLHTWLLGSWYSGAPVWRMTQSVAMLVAKQLHYFVPNQWNLGSHSFILMLVICSLNSSLLYVCCQCGWLIDSVFCSLDSSLLSMFSL